MNKKLLIIIAISALVVTAAGYLIWGKSGSDSVTTKKDEVTGLSIYTNSDYGFSIAYPNSEWEGPVEKAEQDEDIEDPAINVTFVSSSTLEAVVVVGKPGDKETLNAFAAPLDSYTVVTVGGLNALRYEFVTPINEEATVFAKTVMFVFKEIKNGSMTIAYQRLAKTKKEAEALDATRLERFVGGVTFNQE